MTTYYVRKSGSDSNAGTSPATAWATIGKALSNSGIASGDTVYIGAGVYRECVTVGMTSPTVETSIIGDVDGSQTGDAGEVQWTAYLSGDSAAPSYDPVCVITGINYLTFSHLLIVGGGGPCIYADPDATNITIRDCVMFGPISDTVIYTNFGASVVAHWLIERCILASTSTNMVGFYCNGNVSEDIDVESIVQNNLIIVGHDGSGINFDGKYDDSGLDSGSGGLLILNNTILGGTYNISVNNGSAAYPVRIHNNILLNALTNSRYSVPHGKIRSDYNYSSRRRFEDSEGVTLGTHDKCAGEIAPLLHFGQEWLQGKMPRPFLSPMNNSPLLGFGNESTYTTPPVVDLLNRPRPAGGQSTDSAIGAYERHDTAIREDTTADAAPGIKIVGPGDHEFQIPVDATTTTISVKARYDSDHGSTNKPQAMLLANPSIGVTAETLTMSEAADTWETLTFAAQTPTAKGVVRVRLISRAEVGSGAAYFDTFAVT